MVGNLTSASASLRINADHLLPTHPGRAHLPRPPTRRLPLFGEQPIDPHSNEIPDRLIVGQIAGQATQLWRPVRFDGPVAARCG